MIFSFCNYQRKVHLCLHRKFIVVQSELNEKMDHEEHYPQNINYIALFLSFIGSCRLLLDIIKPIQEL